MAAVATEHLHKDAPVAVVSLCLLHAPALQAAITLASVLPVRFQTVHTHAVSVGTELVAVRAEDLIIDDRFMVVEDGLVRVPLLHALHRSTRARHYCVVPKSFLCCVAAAITVRAACRAASLTPPAAEAAVSVTPVAAAAAVSVTPR